MELWSCCASRLVSVRDATVYPLVQLSGALS